MGLMVATSTGCGALGAMANPKVAFAITEKAPMPVVVRRADDAAAIAKEVDRLLTQTPTSASSDWLKQVGPDPKDAAPIMSALKKSPMYMLPKPSKVIPAEVWARTLPDVQSSGGDSPNLLTAIDASLGSGYSDVMAKKQEIADLNQQIEDEKTAASADGVTPDDKKSHQDAQAKLEKTKSEKEDALGPIQKTFVDSIKAIAAKVPADQQDKYRPAIANLLAALDDASVADGAALVGYPMALPGLKDTNMLMGVVKGIASDVLEEKLGTLPTGAAAMKVEVTVNGNGLDAKISGIADADLGSLNMGDLVKETVTRSGKWFVHALTLPAAINSTENAVSFEHDVLRAINAGFNPPAAGMVLVVEIPAADSPLVMSAAPAAHLSFGAKAKVGGSASAGGSIGGAVGGAVSGKASVGVKAPAVSASATVSTDDSDPNAKKKKGGKADAKAAAPKADDKDKKKK
jgi:hypothetical protein